MANRQRRYWRMSLMAAGSVLTLSVLLDDRIQVSSWLASDALLPFTPLISVLVFSVVALGGNAGLGR